MSIDAPIALNMKIAEMTSQEALQNNLVFSRLTDTNFTKNLIWPPSQDRRPDFDKANKEIPKLLSKVPETERAKTFTQIIEATQSSQILKEITKVMLQNPDTLLKNGDFIQTLCTAAERIAPYESMPTFDVLSALVESNPEAVLKTAVNISRIQSQEAGQEGIWPHASLTVGKTIDLVRISFKKINETQSSTEDISQVRTVLENIAEIPVSDARSHSENKPLAQLLTEFPECADTARNLLESKLVAKKETYQVFAFLKNLAKLNPSFVLDEAVNIAELQRAEIPDNDWSAHWRLNSTVDIAVAALKSFPEDKVPEDAGKKLSAIFESFTDIPDSDAKRSSQEKAVDLVRKNVPEYADSIADLLIEDIYKKPFETSQAIQEIAAKNPAFGLKMAKRIGQLILEESGPGNRWENGHWSIQNVIKVVGISVFNFKESIPNIPPDANNQITEIFDTLAQITLKGTPRLFRDRELAKYNTVVLEKWRPASITLLEKSVQQSQEKGIKNNPYFSTLEMALKRVKVQPASTS